MCFGYLSGEALPDVTRKPHIQSRRLQDMIDETGRCCLPVASCDADHLCTGVTTCKFNLRDHMNPGITYFLYQGGSIRYSRTLYNLTGPEYTFFGMAVFFKFNSIGLQCLTMFVLKRATIGKKHIKPLFCSKYGRSNAAFTASKYNY